MADVQRFRSSMQINHGPMVNLTQLPGQTQLFLQALRSLKILPLFFPNFPKKSRFDAAFRSFFFRHAPSMLGFSANFRKFDLRRAVNCSFFVYHRRMFFSEPPFSGFDSTHPTRDVRSATVKLRFCGAISDLLPEAPLLGGPP